MVGETVVVKGFSLVRLFHARCGHLTHWCLRRNLRRNYRANQAEVDASPCFGLFAKNSMKGVPGNAVGVQKCTRKTFIRLRPGLLRQCFARRRNEGVDEG